MSYGHTLKKPLTCSPHFVSIGKMSLMLHAISQTSERSIFTTLSTFADSKTEDCFLQKTLGTFVGGGVGGGGGGGEKGEKKKKQEVGGEGEGRAGGKGGRLAVTAQKNIQIAPKILFFF